MRISRIELGYISIPLVTPFKTALRTVGAVNDLIIRISTDEGTAGYGEAPPTAVITGDTRESIEAAIRGYIAPAITGMPLESEEELSAVMAAMEKAIARNTSAKAAVDMAVYDLYARQKGLPLFRLLGSMPVCEGPGGPGGAASRAAVPGDAGKRLKRTIETDITISVNEPEEMVRDSLRAVRDGFRILKVKVGKGGERDVDRIRRIRQAVGGDVCIRVDANQGWSSDEAIRTIRAMEDAGLGIELVEQPVSYHDFRGMQRVTAAVDTPILADESVFSVEDAGRLIEEHGADLINIKLMKTGGIHNALRICDMADRFGVKCMMGCMLESKVSVSAGVHLAAARECITMADLDGPSLCREDPYTGGPVYDGALISLTEDPGLGITGVPVDFETLGA